MMYYGSMRKCHFVGISDEIGRGEEWYLYITLLVQQQQQKVVRAMEKEQKTPKMGTDLEELSVTQEIDRDLASKICRNSHRSFEKGPCFVSSKEGCIGISHICPKRGCFSLQRSEAKIWCSWPWPGFSMILPKGQGLNTLALKIRPTPCDQESALVSCAVLSVKGGIGNPAKWALFTVCCF